MLCNNMENDIIKFLRQKDYKLIEKIGSGGTGVTVLLEDEIINEKFVCKKYSPQDPLNTELYFSNFVSEIKILHNLYHKNIVRIFNYYLYPERSTGYILMEYVKGSRISDYLEKNPDKLDNIFLQTVEGFKHLEETGILHRDLRPENILVSDEGIVKIIDFGFGKKIEFEADYGKSISLNWRYPVPEEFSKQIYDHKTEIYFVGKLFEEIITENNLDNFGYKFALGKMIDRSYEKRAASFFDIDRMIILDKATKVNFSKKQKDVYTNFANNLSKIFSKLEPDVEYVSNIENIIAILEDAHEKSMLESKVQNPVLVSNAFIKGTYRYYKSVALPVVTLKEFLDFFKGISKDKQKIVLNNLWQRFDAIEKIEEIKLEDIPF